MGVTASRSTAANLQRKYVVPIVLGVAMLTVVIAAVLTTNSGSVQAQTSSQSSSSPSFSWTNAGLAALVVVPAGLLAMFLLGRPRPSATPGPTIQLAPEGSNPPSGPLGAAVSQASALAATSTYRDAAQDVGRVTPAVPIATTRTAEAAAPRGGAVAGGNPRSRIGWLVSEIDGIYRESAQRDPRLKLWERAPEPLASPGESSQLGGLPTTPILPPPDERTNGSVRSPESSKQDALWIAHATADFHIGSPSATKVGKPQDGPTAVIQWRKPPSI
jgi:hypothetical protein